MFYLVRKEKIEDFSNKETLISYLDDLVDDEDENINDFIIIEGKELYPVIIVQDVLNLDDFHKFRK